MNHVVKCEKPMRLDLYLTQQFPFTSRHFWQQHISTCVKVFGKPASKSLLVKNGETIEISFDPFHIEPQANADMPLEIVFANEDWLAVNKTAGVKCQPLLMTDNNTVVNAMVARYPQLLKEFPKSFDAGLLNRLDIKTSGLLLFARHKKSYDTYWQAHEEGLVKKTYLAKVHGKLDHAGEINIALTATGKNSERMRAAKLGDKKKWQAHTEYHPVKQEGEVTFLAVSILRGVRHQIRCHLSLLGHAVVGDDLYGDFIEADRGYSRYLLHAWKVHLPQGFGGDEIVAPVPPQMF